MISKGYAATAYLGREAKILEVFDNCPRIRGGGQDTRGGGGVLPHIKQALGVPSVWDLHHVLCSPTLLSCCYLP